MRSYQQLLSDVLENGESHDDRTGVGTLSVFGRQWRHNLQDGFPLLTTKKVPFRWVFEELMWFLSGSTNEKDLRDRGVDIWKEWATKEQCERFGRPEGDLGPIYGHLWRSFGGYYSTEPGVDQVSRLLYQITHNPNSRRHIVTGWDPKTADDVALPPCHTLWQIKCHTNSREMSLHLYARSIDIFLGLPFNIASYALLLKLISTVTNYVARDLVVSFGDLHLYKNHIEQAKIQLSRQPHNLPALIVRTLPHPPEKVSALQQLISFSYDDLDLIEYHPHPKIKADVAV